MEKQSNCSTWNILLKAFLLIFIVFGIACEKRDPKPELKDSIYQDMLAQQAEADRIAKDAEGKIKDLEKQVLEARINTGVAQKAQRQIYEFKKLIDKMNQQITYWKIRSFERLKHVRTKASTESGPYVSDPKEWEEYNSEKKLRVAKNAWDLKARFKETGFDYNPVLMGEEPGAPKPKAAPPAEGGGHH